MSHDNTHTLDLEPEVAAAEAQAPAERPDETGDAESSSLLRDLGEAVSDPANLDLLLDVNLELSVELGRARLKFRDVLNLAQGSVVELARQTSEPVDILVNGAVLATGEVVVVDDHFAVRVTRLLSRVERLKRVI